MSSASNASDTTVQNGATTQKRSLIFSFLHLPRNVYLLLFFTTGKGFQLTISALTLNYYVHSLGYHPDFIGLFSAMPAIGVLIAAVPSGWLADRIGRKPVLLMTAILTPLFLMAIGLVSSAPLLLALGLMQGLVSTAYWVTNLPLLVESTTEAQRVGVLALNSFLLLGVGALGNLLGGAIPEFAARILHTLATSSGSLSWSIIVAALFTLIFGLPLWFLQEPKKDLANKAVQSVTTDVEKIAAVVDTQPSKAEVKARRAQSNVILFGQLLLPDLLFTM
jgi:MFS family permease